MSGPVGVMLSSAEIMVAAMAGVMRQIENIKKGRAPAYGAGDLSDWQLHVEGCLGEMALAKHLGVYWSGKGKLRDADVGGAIDVRTRSRHDYDLILHEQDEDERAFWLVTGRNGSYKIVGWCLGRDGKRKEYWSDPAKGRPAFFVPRGAMRDPSEWGSRAVDSTD